jgi:hypothetical protein
VLDIGGGQLAFLASTVWNDNGCVADIDETTFAGLRAHGVDGFVWNLAMDDGPSESLSVLLCVKSGLVR